MLSSRTADLQGRRVAADASGSGGTSAALRVGKPSSNTGGASAAAGAVGGAARRYCYALPVDTGLGPGAAGHASAGSSVAPQAQRGSARRRQANVTADPRGRTALPTNADLSGLAACCATADPTAWEASGAAAGISGLTAEARTRWITANLSSRTARVRPAVLLAGRGTAAFLLQGRG